MSTRLFLDTHIILSHTIVWHIILWRDAGDLALRPATCLMLEERWRAGNLSFVSAMTAWEMARRADGGLIELDLAPDA